MKVYFIIKELLLLFITIMGGQKKMEADVSIYRISICVCVCVQAFLFPRESSSGKQHLFVRN